MKELTENLNISIDTLNQLMTYLRQNQMLNDEGLQFDAEVWEEWFDYCNNIFEEE